MNLGWSPFLPSSLQKTPPGLSERCFHDKKAVPTDQTSQCLDMSHGVKRLKESPEALQARRQREISKIEQYTTLSNQVLGRRHAGDFSEESLDLTKHLLAINPEFYTIWNYRRNILSSGIFPRKTAKEINDILAGDLALTMAALRQYPKVYWIWNHRKWCLEHVPDGPGDDQYGWRKSVWAHELYVVEKMLDADARNFHAWDYRRYVLARSYAPHSPYQELAYTTRKIEANFSNFSAWHQRAKIYSVLWQTDVGEGERTKTRDREFELVKQAMYTDPADQSVWLYHRWLVGLGGKGESRDLLEREITGIEELMEIEPESKWCLDSLVYYKSLLLRHSYSDTLAHECIELLSKLRELDPFRKRRYIDMANDMTNTREIPLLVNSSKQVNPSFTDI
ncbi:rab-protein geranylgeranyltransferase [Hysterangium stoloniferum]|nr:rab-protein geranylgeranyltransferase [Hysterangium stoloniferum]